MKAEGRTYKTAKVTSEAHAGLKILAAQMDREMAELADIAITHFIDRQAERWKLPVPDGGSQEAVMRLGTAMLRFIATHGKPKDLEWILGNLYNFAAVAGHSKDIAAPSPISYIPVPAGDEERSMGLLGLLLRNAETRADILQFFDWLNKKKRSS